MYIFLYTKNIIYKYMSNYASVICKKIIEQFDNKVKCISKENIVKVRVLEPVDYKQLAEFPIKELSIYTSNPITHLSKDLEVLKINNNYNFPLPTELPTNLEILIIGDGFNQPLPILNENLKILQLGDSFDQRLKLSKAINLTILKLGKNYNKKIIYLPDKIKKVIIKNPNYEHKLPLSKFNVQLLDTIEVYGLTNKNSISNKMNKIREISQQKPSLTVPTTTNTETYYESINYFTDGQKSDISKVVEPFSQFVLRPHDIKNTDKVSSKAQFSNSLPSFQNFLASENSTKKKNETKPVKKIIEQPAQMVRREQIKEKINRLKKQAENYRQKSKEKSQMADNLLTGLENINQNVDNKLSILLKHEKLLKQEANKINRKINYLQELTKSTLFGQGDNFYQKQLNKILADNIKNLNLDEKIHENNNDIIPVKENYKSQLLYRKKIANKIKKLQSRADFYRNLSQKKNKEVAHILDNYPNKYLIPKNIRDKVNVLEHHSKLFKQQINKIDKRVRELSENLPNAFNVQLLRRTQIKEKIQELENLANKYRKIANGKNKEYYLDPNYNIERLLFDINKKIYLLKELYKSTLYGRGNIDYQKYLNELIINNYNQNIKHAQKKNVYVISKSNKKQ